MNDQLQAALADILTKTTNAVEAGVGFLQSELPDVIRQLLIWKAAESGIYFLLSVSIASAILYGYYRVFKWFRSLDEDLWDHPELMLFILTVPLWIVPATLFSLRWLQILVAPKIYLIEYAASLAK